MGAHSSVEKIQLFSGRKKTRPVGWKYWKLWFKCCWNLPRLENRHLRCSCKFRFFKRAFLHIIKPTQPTSPLNQLLNHTSIQAPNIIKIRKFWNFKTFKVRTGGRLLVLNSQNKLKYFVSNILIIYEKWFSAIRRTL